MSQSRLQDSNESLRHSCWVCSASEEDDNEAKWVKPCRCQGTTKWVHQNCLQRWIDKKQKGNSSTKVACPVCRQEYIIILPRSGPFICLLEKADRFIYKTCPFLACGMFIGSVYCTAVTYGAVTVMQVLGHKEGLNVMGRAHPLFLLIGLPTIPVMLILGKMVRWEDYLLRLWRKHSSKLPLLNYLFPDDCSRIAWVPAETVPLSEPLSTERVLCGALILPTIATIVGKLMFGSVQSNFQRMLLGGIGFITIKGMLKIYYKQQEYLRQVNPVIRDYEEPQPPTRPRPHQVEKMS